jgi:perosamine synthetase
MTSRSAPQTTPKVLRLADHRFGPDVLAGVEEVLASGQLTLGPRVAEFEHAVAAHVGVAHAVAVSSGTAALHLALVGLGIAPGDEVVLPDFTHPATGNVVLHRGARPVLVDVDPGTYNLDAGALERALTPRTRLVIAVDLFGLPADYPALEKVLEPRGIPILCDAACSLGAELSGESPARRGEAAIFSFHPRKILTTGEGGMIVTDNPGLATRLARLRNHGFERRGEQAVFHELGFNYRMSDVLAVLGSAQLPRLTEIVDRRNYLARLLSARLEPLEGIRAPATPAEGVRPTFQAYVAVLDEEVDRGRFIAALADKSIESTIGTYALHAQPSFRDVCGTEPGDVPVSWMLAQRSVALPLHPRLSETDILWIAESVSSAIEETT